MLDVREHYKTTKCATCMISSGCSWGCIRGDDLAEIAELRKALSDLLPDYLEWKEQGVGRILIEVRRTDLRAARALLA